VYSFGDGNAEGDGTQKDLLGGKGANLHEMTKIGLPVPAGFTISTDVCKYYYDHEKSFPTGLKEQVASALKKVEDSMGLRFGDAKAPLLVSVRSGAKASMPGMMDTILNLGLNDKVAEGVADQSKDPRFAYDSYRRFIAMYADVVLSVEKALFEEALERKKESKGITEDTELSADDLKALVKEFKGIVLEISGRPFPDDPQEQLWGAIGAVFNSWMNPRAITYRRLNNIPQSWGTAVNVQSMVFGNMGNDCATGVAFTRDPSSGEKKFFGEYLINAQGEDVVAGTRTPQPINDSSKNDANKTLPTLQQAMPKAYEELVRIYQKLESHYKDMQDIEFTIQKSRLFMLQCRSGKRTAAAAVRIAVEMVQEGLISEREAITRVQPEQLDQLLHPTLDPKAKKDLLAKGLPASPGAASGQIVFDPDTATHWVKELSRHVILVRVETSPEDIHGMSVAQGILTARGGMTSHAAVVARGMGKPCVAGCGAIKVSHAAKEMMVNGRTFKEGDWLTIDGASGSVFTGRVETVSAALSGNFQEFMSWVDRYRKLGVRANADTPHDAKVARSFGAEGIGLCRTEHMFFESDRIDAVREMILAESKQAREAALAKILPMQRADFEGIFREMDGLPVTIRLLDPPLHEFLPHSDEEISVLGQKINQPFERLKQKVESLHEFNPMLGHRGCRLGVSFPEIYLVQVRAIIEAACHLISKEKIKVIPEIMIPLVGDYRELKFIREYCEAEIKKLLKEHKLALEYKLGTMIELPRAALTANEIAEYAEFFSFGTNDLTQTTYGLSRDDSGMFLRDYLNAKIYEKDPFVSLDPRGVGQLVTMATNLGRKVRPSLKLGICGEHGGDPASIEFCHQAGLDYVSCSPYRVPVARLAAAHAHLKAN
jgi:pyruvate,orthophosphate dikinase